MISKPFSGVCSPSALPHNRIVNRPSCLFVPDNSGLTLIGYADRVDIPIGKTSLEQRLLSNCHLRGIYLHRIMLDPSIIRKNLFKLSLSNAYRISHSIVDYAPRTCRAFVECHDVFAHHSLLSMLYK